MRIIGAVLLAVCVLTTSCGDAGGGPQRPGAEPDPAKGGTTVTKIEVTSTEFKEGEMIPSKYTCDGANVSPPIAWRGVPVGAKSLALISDDPDAPMGTWVHWVVWNIPATCRELPEGVRKAAALADGTRQGITDFREVGYGGPCPPAGTHRYFFKLYALDTLLDLPEQTTKKALLKAIEGHVIGEGQLMGRYARKR